jgi:hypothetical protein
MPGLWWVQFAIKGALEKNSIKHPKREHFIVQKGASGLFRFLAGDANKYWFVKHKHIDGFMKGPFDTREQAESLANIYYLMAVKQAEEYK